MSVERTTFLARPSGGEQPEGDRAHCLELLNGPDAGRRVIVPTEGMTIGRVSPADLVLPEADVSRAHCRLTQNPRGLVVTDLGSTNGTFVDDAPVTGTVALPVGAVLRVGTRLMQHELLTGGQLRKSAELDRDIAAAAAYVRALLPPPLSAGPILADWCYASSAMLGGDAFGYSYLDERSFAFYLMDVAGHGAGAALHAVSVMNVLRQRALPGAVMADPASVLGALNLLFPMEQHAEMYFTIWYGVYDTTTRRLTYASAGQHPAFLAWPGGSAMSPLAARNPMIGAIPGRQYRSESIAVPPGALVYLFSDGVFEIRLEDGSMWDIDSFVTETLSPGREIFDECQRIYGAVRSKARGGELDDDFSLVIVRFPD